MMMRRSLLTLFRLEVTVILSACMLSAFGAENPSLLDSVSNKIMGYFSGVFPGGNNFTQKDIEEIREQLGLLLPLQPVHILNGYLSDEKRLIIVLLREGSSKINHLAIDDIKNSDILLGYPITEHQFLPSTSK